MMIHEITEKAGAHKRRKRIGRGPGSGKGKTATRGHKGSGSRSGYSRKAAYEGGQMPLYRRVPKRGFSNFNFRREFAVVNLRALEARFDNGEEVTAASLYSKGLVPSADAKVKVLGEGEITKKLTVSVAAFSKSAQEKITGAGGTATVQA